jgi:DNA-binding MarR family transcriptional regulator
MRATGRIPTKIFSEHELEPGERLTLCLMYSLARADTCTVWRSTAELAEESGYTERGMLKHLTSLKDAGWIEDRQQPDPRGGGTFNGFQLMFDVTGKEIGRVNDG